MKRSWVEQLMGMPISLLARGPDARDDRVHLAVQQVYADLRDADATFSPYRPDSEVSRLAQGEVFEWSDELREVMQLCDEAEKLTRGAFNARTPDGVWDPSGLVKSWAAERATRHLEGLRVDWCLNAGGDVVVGCPSGEPFRVGIQDPHDPAGIVAVIERSSGGVATSGTAARGAHLYDPASGAAAGGYASVTVAGPSLRVADVLATAAFVRDLTVLSSGYEALVVHLDGSQSTTPGWTNDNSVVSSPDWA
ncbi:MAG: ApbE family protein [Frankiales bacterium]|nr:ApbE family protein [Frankiales bacterium]